MSEEQPDLFADLLPKPTLRDVERLRQTQEDLPPRLHLGTTSWSNEDWEGLIYPQGGGAQDYLEYYARTFSAVEIDTTWYRIPRPRMIDAWLHRTPEHFTFAAKIPRVVSHEKRLVDCQAEMDEFLYAMRGLGHRLGPLLLQLAYVARGQDARENEFGEDFLERLSLFLPQLPTQEFRFAVEIRNGSWLRRELLDLLRQHGVALVLNHYYTMPDLAQTRQRLNPQTADFLYVRFLGDRRKMDEHVDELIAAGKKEKHWDRIVWERRAEVENWARNIKEMTAQRPNTDLFVFFNNHFAGYAPGTLAHFAQAWKGT
tara:strand:+ start:500 stop:1441 length:942 start_codon:yes stop_codon:yes gene_type:complete